MQIRDISHYRKKLSKKINELASLSNTARRKLVWRLANRAPRETVPVFIVGAQRSGTTMLGQCLGRSPELENLGETDRRAFIDFFLREDETIRQLLENSRYPFIVFKPLKDSHRVKQLLALSPHAKAIWAYRNFGDRINSAVKRFGRHPLDVFAQYKQGQGKSWQLEGLSKQDGQLIKNLDIDSLSESDGAALMWYVRNSLFFNQNLAENDRVLLWSYDDFVAHPDGDLKSLTQFLDTSYYPFMVSKVHSRSLNKDPRPVINPEIESLCESMNERLDLIKKSKD